MSEFCRAWKNCAPLAKAQDLTVAQLSVRWTLTHPAATCAIIGIKSRDQIDLLKAAEGTLPNDVWHKAANIIAAIPQI